MFMFFAPIDGDIIVECPTAGDETVALYQYYGMTDDCKYPYSPNTWDVDAQTFVVQRDTLEECKIAALLRFKESMIARYQDAEDSNAIEFKMDICLKVEDGMMVTLPWEEYWAPFEQLCDELFAKLPTLG